MTKLLISTFLLALVHLTLHGEPALLARDLPVHIAVEIAVELLLRDRSPGSPLTPPGRFR